MTNSAVGSWNQILTNAQRTIDECSVNIAFTQERADALHPKTVLAAGYAILRDPAGSPLTDVVAVSQADQILAEMRDGTERLVRAS